MIAATSPVDWSDTTATNVSCPHMILRGFAVVTIGVSIQYHVDHSVVEEASDDHTNERETRRINET